jgi:NADPH:quinone reductase-like Zn-dependent oxidoreductase
VGSRVRRFKPGDKVYADAFYNKKGGFYAEYVAVSAENVGHAPATLSLKEAGAIPITGLTALQGIDDALQLKRGESVIIHGASGGVGSLAIQFAKFRKGRVLATAVGRDGLAFVRRLGADDAVDGKTGDIVAAAQRFAPAGIDAVLGLVGGEGLERCLDTLRKGGRLAYPNGIEPEPKKRRGIKFIPYDGVPGVQFQRLTKAVDAAKLRVPIAAAFPMEEARKAFERLAAGHVLGKIVLRVR